MAEHECCQLTTDRLTERVELRPNDRVLRGHLWKTASFCRPTVVVRGIFVEERETDYRSKDFTTEVTGGAGLVTVGIPVCGRGRGVLLRGAGGKQIQQNHVTGEDNYNVDIWRYGIGGRYCWNRWYLEGDVLVKQAEQGGSSIFKFRRTTRVEPNLTFRYGSAARCALAAAYLESTVERDVEADRSYLLTQFHLLARYEKILCVPHRALGIEGQAVYYDQPSNWEQGGSLWFRTGFPQVERYCFFRYQFDYRRFDHVVFPYLSFNHRVAHSGTFAWRYPIVKGGCFQIEYTYTWMRTRELNDPGQQTRPDGQIVPVVIFKQTLNTNRILARHEQWLGKHICLFAASSYYFDAFKYRAWRVRAGLRGSY